MQKNKRRKRKRNDNLKHRRNRRGSRREIKVSNHQLKRNSKRRNSKRRNSKKSKRNRKILMTPIKDPLEEGLYEEMSNQEMKMNLHRLFKKKKKANLSTNAQSSNLNNKVKF